MKIKECVKSIKDLMENDHFSTVHPEHKKFPPHLTLQPLDKFLPVDISKSKWKSDFLKTPLNSDLCYLLIIFLLSVLLYWSIFIFQRQEKEIAELRQENEVYKAYIFSFGTRKEVGVFNEQN